MFKSKFSSHTWFRWTSRMQRFWFPIAWLHMDRYDRWCSCCAWCWWAPRSSHHRGRVTRSVMSFIWCWHYASIHSVPTSAANDVWSTAGLARLVVRTLDLDRHLTSQILWRSSVIRVVAVTESMTTAAAAHHGRWSAAIWRTAATSAHAGRGGRRRTDHDRWRQWGGRPSLVRAESSRLVLGLGAPQSRLLSHHALPVGRQHALFAVTKAELTVALVAFEYDLLAMVAATRTIRRRSGRPGADARAGRTAAQIGLLVGGLWIHPALVGHHGVDAWSALGRQIEVGFNDETWLSCEVIHHPLQSQYLYRFIVTDAQV